LQVDTISVRHEPEKNKKKKKKKKKKEAIQLPGQYGKRGRKSEGDSERDEEVKGKVVFNGF